MGRGFQENMQVNGARKGKGVRGGGGGRERSQNEQKRESLHKNL